MGNYENKMAFENSLIQQAEDKRRRRATAAVMTDWQTAQDAAKAANEGRYAEINTGYDTRYNTALSTLAGLGDAQKADTQRQYEIAGSQQQQALVNSGLSSTTIRPAVIQQNASAMQRALDIVNERLQTQQLNLQTGLSKDKLDFMERREDEYPDMNYYLELLKQAGNYA